jgi:hypothetical protein
MTVETDVRCVVESETPLTLEEVVAKAKGRDCEFEFSETDWGDLKIALEELKVEEVELEDRGEE